MKSLKLHCCFLAPVVLQPRYEASGVPGLSFIHPDISLEKARDRGVLIKLHPRSVLSQWFMKWTPPESCRFVGKRGKHSGSCVATCARREHLLRETVAYNSAGRPRFLKERLLASLTNFQARLRSHTFRSQFILFVGSCCVANTI